MLYLYTSVDFVQTVLNRPGQPVVQYGSLFLLECNTRLCLFLKKKRFTTVAPACLHDPWSRRATTIFLNPPKEKTKNGAFFSFVTLNIAKAEDAFFLNLHARSGFVCLTLKTFQ